MANQQHIEWLIEGVELWNKRRQSDDFLPDFSETDLRLLFKQENRLDVHGRFNLERINLREANLRETNLSYANLSWAYLERTDFSYADLQEVDLREAHIESANFLEADLSKAILTGALFTRSSLKSTNLTGANARTFIYSRQIIKNYGKVKSRTDLRSAYDLEQQQVDMMIGDSGTILPEHITRPEHWLDLDGIAPEILETVSGQSNIQSNTKPAERSRLNENLAISIRRRTRSEIRSALQASYPEPRNLAQHMSSQLQAEIALIATARPNSDEAIQEQNQRLNLLNEALLAMETLHNALPDNSQELSDSATIEDIKEKLARFGVVISKTIKDLDENTGTGGSVWRLGIITACSTVMATCGIPISTAAPIAAGVVGASTIRLILKRE